MAMLSLLGWKSEKFECGWDFQQMSGNFSVCQKLIYLFKYPVHYETSEQKQQLA